MRALQRTTAFQDRTGALRASFRKGAVYFSNGRAVVSLLAGGRSTAPRAVVLEYGSSVQGTRLAQSVPGFGKRGEHAFLSTALHGIVEGDQLLRTMGRAVQRKAILG